MSSLGGNAYLAVGCGRRASYVCINDTCALDNVERDARAVVSSNRRTQVSRSNADSALFVLEDDDVRYALAYAHFRTGELDLAEEELKGITKRELFSRATDLRKAIEAERAEEAR